jgi:hypothetical protein
MVLIKKKEMQVFSDGSYHFNNTIIKKAKKVKICNKDHTTFSFNKKDANFLLNSKDFENFKTKYFKF